MEVNIKSNVKEFKKGLSRMQKKQIPFATSVALNLTGNLVLTGLGRTASRTFKGGATPSTLRAFKVGKGIKGRRPNIIFSTKKDLTTQIFLPPWAANYLKYSIDGGVRKTTGAGTGVPTSNRKVNKFGNIPGRRSGIVKGKKQFVAVIKGINGVWERHGKGGRNVRLLIAFEKDPSYKPIFPYYTTAKKTVDIHFKRKMKIQLAKAIRNAK